MLVLSRKKDEKVLLQLSDGQQIEVVVVKIDSGKVRLGFEAGSDITILRSELVQSD